MALFRPVRVDGPINVGVKRGPRCFKRELRMRYFYRQLKEALYPRVFPELYWDWSVDVDQYNVLYHYIVHESLDIGFLGVVDFSVRDWPLTSTMLYEKLRAATAKLMWYMDKVVVFKHGLRTCRFPMMVLLVVDNFTGPCSKLLIDLRLGARSRILKKILNDIVRFYEEKYAVKLRLRELKSHLRIYVFKFKGLIKRFKGLANLIASLLYKLACSRIRGIYESLRRKQVPKPYGELEKLIHMLKLIEFRTTWTDLQSL